MHVTATVNCYEGGNSEESVLARRGRLKPERTPGRRQEQDLIAINKIITYNYQEINISIFREENPPSRIS